MKKLTYILFFIFQGLFAQNPDGLFIKANNQYKEGKFQEAIQTYDSIEKMGFISSELYYNLGNCHYKLNQVAPTIYNYEKALIINPLNEDAANNLVFARRLTIDNIEELPKTIFDKIDASFVKKLSYNQWAIVCVVFSFFGSLLFLGFYFADSSTRKRVFFISSLISFFFLIVSIALTVKEYDESTSKIEAIIYAQEISVKNAPTDNSEDVFTLHEGTKVSVLDSVDDWNKIKIADGKIGWMPQSELKILQ